MHCDCERWRTQQRRQTVGVAIVVILCVRLVQAQPWQISHWSPDQRILEYREHSLSFCCYSFGSGGECCTSEICGTQADCVGRSISEVFFSFDYSLRANFSCTNSGFRFCFYKNFIGIYNSWISRKINRRDVAHWKNIRSHVVREKGKNAKNVHPGPIACLQAEPTHFGTIWTYLYVFWFVFIGNRWIISASFSFVFTEWWIVNTIGVSTEVSAPSYSQSGERIRKHCRPHIVSHIFNGENYTLKTTFN